MTRLVLASSSPRRRQLLADHGYEFLIVAPDVDETPMPGESAQAYARRIASEKALRVSAGDAVVLAADTVVVRDGVILGKPADAAEAISVLHSLSGRSHVVLGGWALAHGGSLLTTDVEETGVRFRQLSSEEIDSYVAGGEPLDRAGSYAIQGGAADFVADFSGSYTNVVGLPMEAVAVALGEHGVRPQPNGRPAT